MPSSLCRLHLNVHFLLHPAKHQMPCAGEHMHEFEEFEASKFVSRLLGKGDWKGFIDKVQVRDWHTASVPWLAPAAFRDARRARLGWDTSC